MFYLIMNNHSLHLCIFHIFLIIQNTCTALYPGLQRKKNNNRLFKSISVIDMLEDVEHYDQMKFVFNFTLACVTSSTLSRRLMRPGMPPSFNFKV